MNTWRRSVPGRVNSQCKASKWESVPMSEELQGGQSGWNGVSKREAGDEVGKAMEPGLQDLERHFRGAGCHTEMGAIGGGGGEGQRAEE